MQCFGHNDKIRLFLLSCLRHFFSPARHYRDSSRFLFNRKSGLNQASLVRVAIYTCSIHESTTERQDIVPGPQPMSKACSHWGESENEWKTQIRESGWVSWSVTMASLSLRAFGLIKMRQPGRLLCRLIGHLSQCCDSS